MLRVPSNVAAPTTITIVVQTPTLGVDLTTVTAAQLNVTRQNTTTATWDLDIVSQTANELVAQYAFEADSIDGVGAYNLQPQLAVTGGHWLATDVTMFVGTTAGVLPQTEDVAYVVGTAVIP